jgi:NAD dependent epimerase/dehydratase family enzyme
MHEEDVVRAAQWLIAHEEVSGPVNLAAPEALPNAAFMRGLRQAWGMPIGLPATQWMIEIGTRLMGTESELVLKSRRVAPGKLRAGGFAFKYPTWAEAAKELCARWRAEHGK